VVIYGPVSTVSTEVLTPSSPMQSFQIVRQPLAEARQAAQSGGALAPHEARQSRVPVTSHPAAQVSLHAHFTTARYFVLEVRQRASGETKWLRASLQSEQVTTGAPPSPTAPPAPPLPLATELLAATGEPQNPPPLEALVTTTGAPPPPPVVALLSRGGAPPFPLLDATLVSAGAPPFPLLDATLLSAGAPPEPPLVALPWPLEVV
jgi:hypothetical protein